MKKLSYLFSLLIAASLIFTSCNNEDPPVLVTGVTLSESAIELVVGGTATLRATVTPNDADNQTVTWASSNTGVATVSNAGVVTAVSAGTATITVTTADGGRTATATVTVNTPTVSATGVTLNEAELELIIGDTETLIATVLPENATNKNVTWSSSDDEIATVDDDGVVTAVSAGTATITVTTEDGDFTATCDVTVEGVKIDGIIWATRNVGAPGIFAANPEDSGMLYQWNRPLGWSASNPITSSDGRTAWQGYLETADIWSRSNDPCPTGWRIPTEDEMRSLAETPSVWTTNGRLFGSAPDQIFLPAVGSRSFANGELQEDQGHSGLYWIRSLRFGAFPQFLDFNRDESHISISSVPGVLSIRCVAE
jgi:hypothetical protein